MAITYTDDVKTVTDGLQTLINAEFKPIPLRIAREFEEEHLATKGEYIRLWCTNLETFGRIPSGVYRNYIYDCVWYFDDQRYRTEKLLDDVVTPRVERMERLLDNNRTYGTGATWYDVSVDTDYDFEEEFEEEESLNVTAVMQTITISRASYF